MMQQLKRIKEITNYYPAQPTEKLHISGRPRSERTPTRLDIQQKQIFRALNLDRFVASWYIQFSARTNPSKTCANWSFSCVCYRIIAA